MNEKQYLVTLHLVEEDEITKLVVATNQVEAVLIAKQDFFIDRNGDKFQVINKPIVVEV